MKYIDPTNVIAYDSYRKCIALQDVIVVVNRDYNKFGVVIVNEIEILIHWEL